VSAGISAAEVAELVLDIWRIRRRAERGSGACDAVRSACEIAMDRARILGFDVREMVGEPYDESLRVRVVHHDGGTRRCSITECLAPAVYFNNELIKAAEVVISGDDNDGGNG